MALEPWSLLIRAGLGLLSTWAQACTVQLEHELPAGTCSRSPARLRGGTSLPCALAGEGGFSCGKTNEKSRKKKREGAGQE